MVYAGYYSRLSHPGPNRLVSVLAAEKMSGTRPLGGSRLLGRNLVATTEDVTAACRKNVIFHRDHTASRYMLLVILRRKS